MKRNVCRLDDTRTVRRRRRRRHSCPLGFNVGDGSLTRVSQTGREMDDLVADGICISPDGRFLYSVNETRNLNEKVGAGGGILAFGINR